MQNPFIVGDEIYLRPLDMDDLDSFVMWLNDEEVRQYLSIEIPLNRIREKEFIDLLLETELIFLLMTADIVE